MNQRKSMASSHYNKLWYQGSAGDYHYFKHIRGYFLDEANFKVPDAQLHIPQPTPYSSDSERWSEVVRLGKDWHAATKDGAADGWRRLTCEAPSHWRCLELEL
ncbi:MAG TPA: hypothetical protein VLC08_08480 [Chitinolyticbacter sp.]|nr:hypothetical protein [Chitinolyticbacter sp.]